MNYKGVIIEESLENKDILSEISIVSTEVEAVIEEHKTPWVKTWTLHTIEIAEKNAEEISEKISRALEKEHNWYADFENDNYHYIIFRNKVFKVDLKNPILYKDAKEYGISLGIPDYQVNFSPKNVIQGR